MLKVGSINLTEAESQEDDKRSVRYVIGNNLFKGLESRKAQSKGIDRDWTLMSRNVVRRKLPEEKNCIHYSSVNKKAINRKPKSGGGDPRKLLQ